MYRMLLVLGLAVAAPVAAQESDPQPSATQEVTITVAPINALEIPNDVVSLEISGVDPDTGLPAPVTDASTSYNVMTNGEGMKITGALDAEYTDGLLLKVELGVPTAGGSGSGGTSTLRTLSTTSQDLISGMARVSGQGLAITYTAEAGVDIPAGTSEMRTVTYTLTSN